MKKKIAIQVKESALAPLIAEQISLQETLDGLYKRLEDSAESTGEGSFDAWRTTTAAIAENTGLIAENLKAQDKLLSGDLFTNPPEIKTTKELFGLGQEADKTTKKLKKLFIKGLSIDDLLLFITNVGKLTRAMKEAGNVEFKIESPKDVGGLSDLVDGLISDLDELALVAAAKAKEIGEAISDSIKSGLQSLATESLTVLGEFLGQAFAGNEDALENLGRGLLSAVGNFMTQLGESMIAIGVAQAAMGIAIAAGPVGAPLAIAAGIALVAAGALFSSISKKGVQTGGGGGFNPASSGGGGFNTGLGTITTETVLSGREIIIVQQREKGFRR